MISLDYLREIFKRQECHYESVAKPRLSLRGATAMKQSRQRLLRPFGARNDGKRLFQRSHYTIHAQEQMALRHIRVYEPDLDKWHENFKTRRI